MPEKKNGNAMVLNISATLQYGATWWQMHASAAKSAIDSMTRSMALEWGEFGIRVNGIAPGPIRGTAGMTKLAGSFSEEDIALTVPLGRMGTTWDIAMGAVYLSSRAGSYVSGHVLVVDGANWLWKPTVAPRELVEELARNIEAKSRATGNPNSDSANEKIKSKL